MNEKLARKLRQLTRRNRQEFYADIMRLSWRNRLGIAWYLVSHRRVKSGH